ncbi:uncharacterized protein EV420DRAFT_1750746 [Desarmillaria tabescens]|uniref:Uncharacterized protein n=1 Tax=Armillaria tabescens TaxID=1929756 RepID=A0AA39JUH9_ARMTA|nr:uncharacterized protein EV420DRAFT_1750746 [Desarmillaria tabescens]KAK0449033.1 hypothetical protein EV420DRAFT_1750746 [Desarmillaria tabescens]
MEIFGELAQAVRENGNKIFTYLMACLFEYLFGKDTIEGIEDLREGLTDQDIIYGNYGGSDEPEQTSSSEVVEEASAEEEAYDEEELDDESEEVAEEAPAASATTTAPFPLLQSSPFGSASPATQPPVKSAFANIKSTPSTFGVFGGTTAFPTSESTHAAFPTSTSTSSNPQFPTSSSLPSSTNGFSNQPTLQFPSSGSPSPFGQPVRPTEGLVNGLTPPASSPFGGFSSSASGTERISKYIRESTSASLISYLLVCSFRIRAAVDFLKHTKASPELSFSDSESGGAVIYTSSEPSMPSPTVPPPLPRKQPISLPSTPTTASSANPLRDFFKGSLKTSIPPATGELSPLIITSPTTSRPASIRNFSFDDTPRAADNTNPFEAISPLKSKGKGKASSEDLDKQTKEDMLERAIAWRKACRSSDAYREKIRKQGQASPSSERKRRLLPNGTHGSVARKRVRRRVNSEYHRPQTDEELARRFKENHEEHQRRWAQGSFLQLIRDHVKLQLSPSEWQIWLSLNPDSDPTAIWLERKFDAPASGRWMGENCTPLEGIADDLERKYRLLDDCSRLRDIIKSLPENRHYVPSLLVIWWAEEGERSAGVGVCRYGVLRLFENILEPFMQEWLDNCSTRGSFNWVLYGRFLKVVVDLMRLIVRDSAKLLRIDVEDKIPSFEPQNVIDSETAFDNALSWLAGIDIDIATGPITLDLQTQRDLGRGSLYRLVMLGKRLITSHRVPFPHLSLTISARWFIALWIQSPPKTQVFILKADIGPATEQFRAAVERYQAQLTQAMAMSVRRSPKRRSVSTETSESGSISDWFAIAPHAQPSPHGQWSYIAIPCQFNIGLASPEPSLVTVAMLRSLTRNMKEKYGMEN